MNRFYFKDVNKTNRLKNKNFACLSKNIFFIKNIKITSFFIFLSKNLSYIYRLIFIYSTSSSSRSCSGKASECVIKHTLTDVLNHISG